MLTCTSLAIPDPHWHFYFPPTGLTDRSLWYHLDWKKHKSLSRDRVLIKVLGVGEDAFIEGCTESVFLDLYCALYFSCLCSLCLCAALSGVITKTIIIAPETHRTARHVSMHKKMLESDFDHAFELLRTSHVNCYKLLRGVASFNTFNVPVTLVWISTKSNYIIWNRHSLI